jgi:CTD small phosphatase-like protein 2
LIGVEEHLTPILNLINEVEEDLTNSSEMTLMLPYLEQSTSSSGPSSSSDETSELIEDVSDLIYSSVEVENIDPDGLPQIDIDQLILLQNMPPIPLEYRFRSPALPLRTRRTPKYTLAVDLDETLCHCSLEDFPDASHRFHVKFQGEIYQISVRLRPYLTEFLERLCKNFELILFTASKRIYADKLLDILDPKRRYFRHRLFREHCILINGNYVKDLSILGRDLSKTIIIDNSPQAFAYHIDNGIPIESWFQKETDEELLSIIPFLESLLNENDVRPKINEKFRMREIVGLGLTENHQLL